MVLNGKKGVSTDVRFLQIYSIILDPRLVSSEAAVLGILDGHPAQHQLSEHVLNMA